MSDQVLIVAALVVAGYVLIALEAFVVPGFGVAGIGGLLCLGSGVGLSLYWFGGVRGTIVLAGVTGLTSAFFVWLPRSRYGRSIVHRGSLAHARVAELAVRVGDVGVAESDLRPAGIGRFEDRRISVVTDGEFVASQTALRVVQTEGSRVVVEPAEPSAEGPAAVEPPSGVA